MAKLAQRALSAPVWYSDDGAPFVLIGGKNYMLLAGSLSISLAVGRKSQASLRVKTDIYTFFAQYQQIAIYDGNTNLLFSGYIATPQAQKPGYQPSLLWTLSCIGQDFIAKKRVVQANYTSMTCGAIVRDIYNSILAAEGVTIGLIYDGPTVSDLLVIPFVIDGNALIPQANLFCKVADALDALVTEASSAGTPYYWSIVNNALYFAPYGAVVGSAIDDTLIDQRNNIPTIIFANPSYRNGQYETGGVDQTGTQTESRKGDGNTTSWPMNFDLASAPTVNVDSVAKTAGVKGIDSGKDFYWQQGSPDIVQDSGATKLTSSNTLNVTYIGQFPSTSLVYDNAQIAYQQSISGGTGIIEEIDNDQTLTSSANALSKASNLLTRYAQQGVQLTFTTRQTGFVPGQLCPADMAYFNLINAQMLIETVLITDSVDGYNIWYQVTAIIGPYDVSWVDFFSSLLAQSAPANSINVGQSQSTSTLLDLTATVSQSANLTISVFACPICSDATLCGNTTIVC